MQRLLQVTVHDEASAARRSIDVHDILDELPMLALLKDQQWMARLPRQLFSKRNKSPRNAEIRSSSSSSSGTDTTLLSPGGLPTPRVAIDWCVWYDVFVAGIDLSWMDSIHYCFLCTRKTARAVSVLVPQRDGDVLEALDARFFTESFDPVAYTLVRS